MYDKIGVAQSENGRIMTFDARKMPLFLLRFIIMPYLCALKTKIAHT